MSQLVHLNGSTYARPKRFRIKGINKILDRAVAQSINYEDQLVLLNWLRDEGLRSAWSFVRSLPTPQFEVMIENFKRKRLQSGTNTATKLTTKDKAPAYEYTNQPGDSIFDSGPGAPMTDTTDQEFLQRMRRKLKVT